MTVKIPTPTATNTVEVLQSIKQLLELREGDRDNKREAFAKKSDMETSWLLPTLLDSWNRYSEYYAAPGFCKDAMGFVHLRGLLAGGTVDATARVFILPEGYRPGAGQRGVYAVATNSGHGRADVEATGEVRPVTGGNTWFSLDGITFKAEQ